MTTIEVTYAIHAKDDPSNATKETRILSNKKDFELTNKGFLSMKYNTLDYVLIAFWGHYLTIRIDSDKFSSFAQAVEKFSGDMNSLINNISDCLYITGYDWFIEYVVEHKELPLAERIEILETGENTDVEAYDYYNGWYYAVGEHFINTRDVNKISEAIGQHVQDSIVEFLDCGSIGLEIVTKYGYNYNGHGIIFRYV